MNSLTLYTLTTLLCLATASQVCTPSCAENQLCSGVKDSPRCFYKLDLVEADTVTFSTIQNDLPWPLTNPRDIGQLIGHGPHCFHMTMEFSQDQPQNLVDIMHQQHCKTLLQKVSDFITEKNFWVPESVCSPLRNLLDGGKGPRYNNDYYVQYSYNYKNLNDTRKESVYKFVADKSRSQDDLFAFMNGENLGLLLLKEYLGMNLLPAEKEYLDLWWTNEVVELGALGLHCLYGAKTLDNIQKLM